MDYSASKTHTDNSGGLQKRERKVWDHLGIHDQSSVERCLSRKESGWRRKQTTELPVTAADLFTALWHLSSKIQGKCQVGGCGNIHLESNIVKILQSMAFRK